MCLVNPEKYEHIQRLLATKDPCNKQLALGLMTGALELPFEEACVHLIKTHLPKHPLIFYVGSLLILYKYNEENGCVSRFCGRVCTCQQTKNIEPLSQHCTCIYQHSSPADCCQLLLFSRAVCDFWDLLPKLKPLVLH